MSDEMGVLLGQIHPCSLKPLQRAPYLICVFFLERCLESVGEGFGVDHEQRLLCETFRSKREGSTGGRDDTEGEDRGYYLRELCLT